MQASRSRGRGRSRSRRHRGRRRRRHHLHLRAAILAESILVRILLAAVCAKHGASPFRQRSQASNFYPRSIIPRRGKKLRNSSVRRHANRKRRPCAHPCIFQVESRNQAATGPSPQPATDRSQPRPATRQPAASRRPGPAPTYFRMPCRSKSPHATRHTRQNSPKTPQVEHRCAMVKSKAESNSCS